MSEAPIWFQTIGYIFGAVIMLAVVLLIIFVIIVICAFIFFDRKDELETNRRLRRISLERAEKEGASDD